ncbi:MAG: ribonuclease Z [Lachnospiraceae bacterium]|nr:ribonuclease Z [Lachnospiraceae bacterium]
MIVIAVVDDRGGMMFGSRRQSQDRVLRQRVLSLAGGRIVWMNAYTAKQFGDQMDTGLICVDDHFMEKAGPGEFCFVENTALVSYEAQIEKVILFKWNRTYPGDVTFDLDLSAWRRVSTENFVGSSHEKITQETYLRDGRGDE